MQKYLETRWHRLSDAEYNQRWIEKVLSRCTRNENGCLIWSGNLNSDGYPQTNYRAKTVRCHRMLWQITHGVKLAKDIAVCHRCDERLCLEQSHHWLGTWQDNLRDCAAKGRHTNGSKTHCRRGHEYTPETTLMTDAGKGRWRRSCKLCRRIRFRLKAGWTEEEALNTPAIPQNAPTARRRWKKAA
jgi:hypothetical protein